MELKCDCGNNSFIIDERDSCKECEYNGAAFDDTIHNIDDNDDEFGYTYNVDLITKYGLERTEVNDEGVCKLNTSHGNGCKIFTCSKCNKIKDTVFMVAY